LAQPEGEAKAHEFPDRESIGADVRKVNG
jgi:hypothetical protein